MTYLRTIFRHCFFRNKGFAATNANFFFSFYCFISTFFRAIFNFAMCYSSAIKGFPTAFTSNHATIITNSGTTGSRVKFITTYFTNINWQAIGEFSITYFIRVIFPILNITTGMASRAKRYKVINKISLSIIIKKMEWLYMMDRKINFFFTTVLTRIIITFSRFNSLSIPVFSSIINIPAKPSGVIYTTPFGRFAPNYITRLATKIMFKNIRWAPFKFFPASITNNFKTFPINTYSVYFLPMSITRLTTKMMFGNMSHIGLCGIFFPTLFTNKFYHNYNISNIWRIVNGNHFAA